MRVLFPTVRLRVASLLIGGLLGLSLGSTAVAAPVSWGDILSVQAGDLRDVTRPRTSAMRSMTVPLAATTVALSTHPTDPVLLARADLPEFSAAPLSIAGVSLSDAVYTPLVQEPRPAPAASAVQAPSRGIRLPEPGGWTSVLATLALAVFFFLRRLN